MPKLRICSADNCSKRAVGRHWCPAHYARFRKYGDANAMPAKRGRKPINAVSEKILCSVLGCGKRAFTRGWCPAHYQRVRKYGTPDTAALKRPNVGLVIVLCAAAACDRDAKTRGWCSTHYNQWLKHGDPEAVGLTPSQIRSLEISAWYENAKRHTDISNCLIWPFSRHAHTGRAIWAKHDPRTNIVPRLMCWDVYGDPPTPDHHAAHSCGNGHLGCVNPNHLRWATPKENVADQIAHGTYFRGPRGKPLSWDKVRLVRKQGMYRSAREIAKEQGMSIEAVQGIIRNVTYRHVT